MKNIPILLYFVLVAADTVVALISTGWVSLLAASAAGWCAALGVVSWEESR